jgi:hypothetical protein
MALTAAGRTVAGMTAKSNHDTQSWRQQTKRAAGGIIYPTVAGAITGL